VKKPYDTPTSKVPSRKSDDISKDRTISRDTPTHKIHPQKSDEEIEVYNIIARQELYIFNTLMILGYLGE